MKNYKNESFINSLFPIQNISNLNDFNSTNPYVNEKLKDLNLSSIMPKEKVSDEKKDPSLSSTVSNSSKLQHLLINFLTGTIVGIALLVCLFIYNKNMKEEDGAPKKKKRN